MRGGNSGGDPKDGDHCKEFEAAGSRVLDRRLNNDTLVVAMRQRRQNVGRRTIDRNRSSPKLTSRADDAAVNIAPANDVFEFLAGELDLTAGAGRDAPAAEQHRLNRRIRPEMLLKYRENCFVVHMAPQTR